MGKASGKKDLLDLHGFQSADVVDEVDRFITEMTRKNKKTVYIMPGKGSGKVKAEVLRYLKLGGFPWQYEKTENGKPNEGVLVVFLD